MRLIVLVTMLIAVTACDFGTPSSFDWQVERLHGPRLDLAPGQSLEIPLFIDASGFRSVDLEATISVVSHGSRFEAPQVQLVGPSGEASVVRENPLVVLCTEECQGEHTLSVSLLDAAEEPATITPTIVATGRGRREGLTARWELPTNESAWTTPIYPLTTDFESAGLLHITSTIDPVGELRFELPTADVAPAPRSAVIGSSSGPSPVAAGTSFELSPPPNACVEGQCEWSVALAAVAPWQVSATTNEFDVSLSETEQVTRGRTNWTGAVSAGSTTELQLDVWTPASTTSTSLVVNVETFWSDNESRFDFSVIFDGREIQKGVYTDAARVVVPLTCGSDRCSDTLALTIDASSLEADGDLELVVTVSQASVTPESGNIEVELRP